MASKNTYYVGTSGFANYAKLTDIPAGILAAGDTTIVVGAGTYDPLTDAVLNDLSLIGQGSASEIIVSGPITIANTSSGTITFENMTLTGTANADVVEGAVNKLGAASTPLHFKRCVLVSTSLGVVNHAESAFATTADSIILDYCDATATDRAMYANSNVAVNWSSLNTTANAYITPGTGATAIKTTATVRASTSGGSNTGNMTETVIALLS